jgi:acetoin utilization deacetylase AcuC-like enzyme
MATNEAKSAGTALVYDRRCKDHDTGRGHPECPERLDAVISGLEDAGTLDQLIRLKPRSCPDEILRHCHSDNYLNIVKRDVAAGLHQLTTGDTTICAATLDIARLAAGGVLTAVDAVMSGEADNVFCALRPPGHHACPNHGMGFCVFSNAAVGARFAQQKHGIDKVLIADWDVHHGNGTQDVFYEDDTVFYFSTHQSPWYPGTGAKDETGKGKGLGTTLNQPFGSGAGRQEIIGAFADKLLAAAARFKPELVIISAGFDSRVGDPLGEFRLVDEDFAELTRIMMQLAAEHANGRLVSVLEGGYSLDGLAKAAAAHVGALAAVDSGRPD